MKATGIVLGLVLGLVIGIGGGYALWGMDGGTATLAGTGPGGGQFDREQMASMTDEEREAFFAEQGIESPLGGGMRMGGGAMVVEGTVIALDAESITVELTDGGSQTVYLGDGTTYATVSDVGSALLSEGSSVAIAGTPQADGVFTADNVTVSE